MRPRVFPAEDTRRHESYSLPTEASMRPRVFPAEDPDHDVRGIEQPDCASMRPRVFPAEDARGRRRQCRVARRFNEAAGIPRGRLRRTG